MNKILVTLALSFTLFSTGFGQTKNFIDQPYIEVSGYADTLVTPDLIFIKIIISEKDSRDKISIEEQESKMITALNSLSINTETDLTTSDMLSNYKYYVFKRKDILKTKEYILKVADAATVSKVFVQLEDLGISNTSIERVEHSDLEFIQNTCRAKAIENAHQKAVALAKPISQAIGNAIHIYDNEAKFDDLLQGRLPGVSVRNYAVLDKKKYETPTIEFEKIKVSATVSVKFILK
ncbi:MAG: SIMPL domain-containing protein [Ferruginibacter sp.]